MHDHALGLQKAGRHEEALALLALYPADAEWDARFRTLATRSQVNLKRWPEAMGLAEKPGLEPLFLAWVAQEMYRAERKNDAARLLGDACPKLTGKDAETCRQLLAAAAE